LNILILEDDQIFGETLEMFLSLEGYNIDLVTTIQEAEDITFSKSFDLYLFDINLPDGKGLKLLNELREAEDNTPTIFITALTDLNSMAEGFKLGAMDYIKKPFVPEELIIRIEAKFTDTTLRYRNISYNTILKRVLVDGIVVDIGIVSTKLFVKLLENIGNIVSKDELLECLDVASENALRVNLTKLKQKLSIDIKNIRSKGYILEEC
jgi:DNA-binding response OmpR family regulator